MPKPYHVYPLDDWIEHKTEGTDCLCEPVIKEDGMLVIHNAIDQRERNELEGATGT